MDSSTLPQELQVLVANINSPGRLADLAASSLDISLEEKQSVLETLNVKERLERMARVISRELELTKVETQIQEKVQSEMTKSHLGRPK